ncbi:hypothetical protein LXA43DRAFT_670541 [Ganoderma leucocontextum]|nr:hypothetical protein LXA43DRAFT_670541 [Ganoderma leucocontextum]
MDAVFRIGEDGSGSGVVCSTTAQPSSSVFLYGASSLPLGRHTLLITNHGHEHELSLSGFQAGGGSARTTSTSHTSTPSPTPTLSLPSISPSSPPSSALSMSAGAWTSRSSTVLTLPTPHPTSISSESSSSTVSQHASGSPATSLFDVSGLPSYTVSTYTALSIIGGTATTVVIQSTVGTQQHQRPHGTIPGAVVGGAVFLPLLVGVGLWWRIRRRCNRVRSLKATSNPDLDTDKATRRTPATTESVHRAGSLANPSSREPLHHDAVPIAASLSCSQGNSGPQSTTAPPPPSQSRRPASTTAF